MTTAILVVIAVMWIPVAMLFLGYGEPKGTGAVTGFVGIVTVLSAILQTAIFKDGFTGGLLFAHGILYITISYALLNSLKDMRSVGNVSLTVALISTIYAFIFYTGTPLIAKNDYLSLACTGYAVLTLQVWLNAYGKFSAKGLALSLIIWVFVGLWVPAFWLMTTGKLPM
ncbi:AmiS/UreI family transporter [Ammoniphilus sp. 3BR4]|uniref:AmiS/UreI family transporter n=1 Tax=Ammoniphilus sp. 3BR4 TaxID=3158265 RepID=UPI0034670BD4